MRPASGISSAHAPALDLPARFMALGMIIFAVVMVLAPWANPLLLTSFYNERVIAFVHLNTLGIIGALLIGASYQLVPVILQTPLASVRLGRLSFWFYLGGVAGLLIGLLELWLPALAAGGALLSIAFGLYIGIIVTTLYRAPHRDVVSWHLAIAMPSVAMAVVLGVTLAANKTTGFLDGGTLTHMAGHATLMLGGWVAVMLEGVAYRLVGMFTLAEDYLWRRLAWVSLALTAVGAWMMAGGLMFHRALSVGLVGALVLLAGFVVFLIQLAHLYHRRRRRGFDVHIPFALSAAIFAFSSVTLIIIGLIRREEMSSPVWVAAGWLAIAGMAETAIQGFFYKISTFLVWLRRYAPVAGRQRVPRLEQLYHRRLAVTGWVLWLLAVIVNAVAILLDLDSVARLGGVLVTAALACFLVNVGSIASHWRKEVPAPRVPRHLPSKRTADV
jgi:hypothetical protein